jgi:hypothetical protein
MGTFQQVGQSGAAVLFLLLLSMAAANLPFLSTRILGFLPVPARLAKHGHAAKPVWVVLLEMLVLYFAVGLTGMWLEHHAGQIAPQRWEFYAITATLFLTLAFPGFVWRFLVRKA